MSVGFALRSLLARWFPKSVRLQPRPGARIWRAWDHTMWGDRFERLSETRVAGWLASFPVRGDLLRFAKDGPTYIFVNVQPCDDPDDMFFATIEALP